MDDQHWLKLWDSIVKLLPALGGAFISLRYLDKEDTGPISILVSFLCSLLLAVFGGNWWIELRGINPESWTAQAIILTVGIVGLVIVTKFVQAIKSISYKELKEWILESLRKLITPKG